MQIRAATIDDIDRITEMHQTYIECWHSREYFERLINVDEPLVLVAVISDKILGYIACRQEWKNTHIVSMGVCPRERVKGIGSRMTHKILEMAATRGCEGVFGHVRESNTVAKALYQKCGFQFEWIDEYEDGDGKLQFQQWFTAQP